MKRSAAGLMHRSVFGFITCLLLVGHTLAEPKATIEVEALVGTYYLSDPSAAQRWSKIIRIDKSENGVQVFENHKRSMERMGLIDDTTVFRQSDVTVGPYPAKFEGSRLMYRREDKSVVVFSIIFEGDQLKGLKPKTEEGVQDLSCTFLNCYLKQ